MNQAQTENAPVAILFADVVGSTRIYDQIGDVAAAELIGGALRDVAHIAAQAGGRHMKNIGDCVMLQFTGTSAAFLAGRSIVDLINRSDATSEVRFRVGLHVGSVVHQVDDLFGDTVNVAAHITKLATPDTMVLTDAAYALLPPSLQAESASIGRIRLKGRNDPVLLYEVRESGEMESTATMQVFERDPAGKTTRRLCLQVNGADCELSPADGWLTIGRAKLCDVVLTNSLASRMHARIGWRDDQVVLIDQSANGTFIQISDQKLKICRQETLLFGTGELRFGSRSGNQDAEVVRFRIET